MPSLVFEFDKCRSLKIIRGRQGLQKVALSMAPPTIVTRDNFNSLLPSILHLIKESEFVSIDTELSGLAYGAEGKYQYYDTPEIRYKRLCSSANNYALLQYGISTWKWQSRSKRYESSSWSFHIFPSCDGSSSNDTRRIAMQLSCLEFLSRHNFDFNKTFKSGVSFNSRAEEANYRARNISSRSDDNREPNNLKSEDILFFESTCKLVRDYFKIDPEKKTTDVENYSATLTNADEINRDSSSSVGNGESVPEVDLKSTKTFEEFSIPPCNSYRRMLLYRKLPTIFPSISIRKGTSVSGDHCLVVSFPTAEILSQMEAETELKIIEAAGFRRVIDHIFRCEKPIVGHNCWLDWMFTYKNFIGPFPSTLSEFQVSLNDAVKAPIFDTKLLAKRVFSLVETQSLSDSLAGSNDSLTNTLNFDSVSLSNNQEALSVAGSSLEKLASLVDDYERWGVKTPVGGGKTNSGSSSGQFHDAGFDAFCTGKVFVALLALLSKHLCKELGDIASMMLNDDDSDFIKFKNRLYMMTSDYSDLGIIIKGSGETLHPDRSKLVMVRCHSSEVRTPHVLQAIRRVIDLSVGGKCFSVKEKAMSLGNEDDTVTVGNGTDQSITGVHAHKFEENATAEEIKETIEVQDSVTIYSGDKQYTYDYIRVDWIEDSLAVCAFSEMIPSFISDVDVNEAINHGLDENIVKNKDGSVSIILQDEKGFSRELSLMTSAVYNQIIVSEPYTMPKRTRIL